MVFESKYIELSLFYQDLDKISSLQPRTEHTEERKSVVYKKALELYNDALKYIWMNTKNFHLLKQKRWTKNVILLVYCLIHMIIVMFC